MKDIVLETTLLSKSYQQAIALDKVSLTLERGGIYGFVGQNGAGKTTFMRLVAGLTFPDQGEIKLFGSTGEKALAKERKRMGTIIETPAFYPYLTARENMEAMRLSGGIANKNALDRSLELVGLQDTGQKKIQDFSMGMKQRLGIALALLGEPEFLMLDEPTNGLDPLSIVAIRELLLDLVHEKQITILISSHILSELYLLASHYIIIHQGRILQEISKSQLDERCQTHISILVDDLPRAITVLEQGLNTSNYRLMPDGSIALYDHTDDLHRVMTALLEGDLTIENISQASDSLEDYFLGTIGGVKNA